MGGGDSSDWAAETLRASKVETVFGRAVFDGASLVGDCALHDGGLKLFLALVEKRPTNNVLVTGERWGARTLFDVGCVGGVCGEWELFSALDDCTKQRVYAFERGRLDVCGGVFGAPNHNNRVQKRRKGVGHNRVCVAGAGERLFGERKPVLYLEDQSLGRNWSVCGGGHLLSRGRDHNDDLAVSILCVSLRVCVAAAATVGVSQALGCHEGRNGAVLHGVCGGIGAMLCGARAACANHVVHALWAAMGGTPLAMAKEKKISVCVCDVWCWCAVARDMVFQYVTYRLLYVNCAWDMVSAIAIAGGHETIGRWHTGMWSRKKDQSNRAAKSLMAWFVLTLGIARGAAALDPASYRGCGIVSYLIEGLFALLGFMNGSMKLNEGAAVAVSSFALAACLLASA